MNGVLSPDLTKQLLPMEMFIDYEGELWRMMGAGRRISACIIEEYFNKVWSIFADGTLPIHNAEIIIWYNRTES